MFDDNNISNSNVNERIYGVSQFTPPGGTVLGKNSKTKAYKPKVSVPKAPAEDKTAVDLLFYEYIEKLGTWRAQVFDTNSGVIVSRWNGNYHQHIGGEEGAAIAANWIRAHARSKAKDAAAVSSFKYASKILRMEAPLPAPDRSRTIIPCLDGYLEILPDGRIVNIGVDEELGLTYALNLKCNVGVGEEFHPVAFAENSKFQAFLNFAQPEMAVQSLLQEQCGMCLLPGSYQIANWWYGKGGSGKSTLASLCSAVQRELGTASLHQLKEKFDLEDLVGVSLIRVEEVAKGRWHEEIWKAMVAAEPMTVTRKNEKALTGYRFHAKWIITANNKPFVVDKSDGVWRRICPIEFKNQIPAEDRILDFHEVVLKEEGSAILSWMLEGAKRLVQRGRFLPESEWPESIREKKTENKLDCDSVGAWISEREVKLSTQYSTKGDIYDDYAAWADCIQVELLSREVFWRNLKELLPELETKRARIKNKHGLSELTYTVNVQITDSKEFDVNYINAQESVPFG